MGEEKVPKGSAISRGLKTASSECYKCINGYSREEWAWMSVHVSIMVDLLPDRAKYSVVGFDANGDNPLTFTMGEANYHTWLHKAVAFGNEGDCSASGCGREPWATNAAISTGNKVAGDQAYFQIRLLNQWDLKTMLHDGYGQSVKCTVPAADVGTVQFSDVRNGFSLNETIPECTHDVSATGFNSRSCNAVYYHTGSSHEFFQVVWQQGSTAPHIVTFKATYSGQQNTEKRITFNCERGTPPGYSGDICTDCDGSWEMGSEI